MMNSNNAAICTFLLDGFRKIGRNKYEVKKNYKIVQEPGPEKKQKWS